MKIIDNLFAEFYFQLSLFTSYSNIIEVLKENEKFSPKDIYANLKAGLYDLDDLKHWLDHHQQETQGHYYDVVRSLIDRKFLMAKINDNERKVVNSGWSGINQYLDSFKLLPFVSSHPWQILESCKYSTVSQGPLISIIMPAYNAERTIYIAIKSILSQIYINFELIVINDCSTDKTAEIVRSMCNFDRRVSLINLDKNYGSYIARNIGLLHSKGEFITVHDADDVSHPQKLYLQINEILKHRNCLASISYWIRLDQYGNVSLKRGLPFLRMNISSLLFHKSVPKKIGNWQINRFGADLEYLDRIKSAFSRRAIKKIRLPLSLGLYRDDSLTTAMKTSVFNKIGLQARMKYEEKWRREHLALFYPHTYNLLRFIDDYFLKRKSKL